jgi:hypothetical protein
MDIKELKDRRTAAQKERDQFQPLMDEAYQYAIPFRRGIGKGGAGEKRVDQVFDHTAIDGAFRFAGKLQQDLWPTGQEVYSLEPGAIVIDKSQRDQLAGELGKITTVLHAFDDDGDWDMAFHEMCLDLSAGNGAMLMNSTADLDKLWDPISVPVDELLFENGPNNHIEGIFWKRRMSVRVLFATWPEGTFGEVLRDMLRDKPGDEIEVCLDTTFDRQPNARDSRWRTYVWYDKQDEFIFQSETRTNPWLTPRYFRVPGETYGRGVVMLAMPTIKTLNTAKRIQLMAAAIAMLGIYTAVDDGVFNPDHAMLEPGAFWKVARNAGSIQGPSISRFPDPRLDLSTMVLREMEMGVKATMMDQALPADTAGAKSATEILERVKRLAADHVGAFGRLVKEVIVPSVKRRVEIAYNRGLIKSEIPIDQLLVRVKVKSPLAIAREAARIERLVQWLQMVLAVTSASQSDPNRIAKIEEALLTIGRDMGVPNDLMLTVDERKAYDEKKAKEMAAMAAMAAATGGAAA